jgi:signal transduction histidine kinase
LSDERLNVGPVLARLLGGGVVLLDEGMGCSYADDRACELLGTPDVQGVRADWRRLGELLHVHELAQVREESSMQRTVDLATTRGTRRLRIEAHPLRPAGGVVLVRDVHEHDAADRSLILAAEACAGRPALSGLVHQAKGPLNNFQLTLALLATSLARSSAASNDAASPRWRRYLDVLQTESARLTACINEIGEHAHAVDEPHCDLDMNAIVSDVARLLRHEATLRDAAIEARVTATPSLVHGDSRALRLALVGFALCILDRIAHKGSVTLSVDRVDSRVRVRVAGARAAPAPDVTRTLFELSAVRMAPHAREVAGRLIVELHDGEVSTTTIPPDAWGFSISIPAAAATHSTR